MMHSDRYFDFFSKYISENLGITFSKDNDFQLIRRLEDVCEQAKLDSIEQLHEAFLGSPPESLKKLLLDVATNNETHFFRDPMVFKAMEEKCFVNLFRLGKADYQKLRIWSMACSFGQEAYSLAMVCDTICEQTEFQGRDFEILASDVSHRALSKASSGLYSNLEIGRGLPAGLTDKYFRPHSNEMFEVAPALRQKISFQNINILTQSFGAQGTFDVIFCRNVLIYQKLENKQKILEKIYQSLRPKGLLVLGSGETLNGVSENFEASSASGTLVYERIG